MGKITRLIVFGVALLGATAGPALAGQLQVKAHGGDEVIVTQSTSGEELRGRLIELSPTTMAILVDGRRVEVPTENVLRIDVRSDSLKNGTIIGAAVMGGLSGLTCALIADRSACITGLVFNTGIGALAGAGIDALHKGRSPIYIKAAKHEAGLQVRLRF